jgi:tetratricopeptide (TPR) repeat protein
MRIGARKVIGVATAFAVVVIFVAAGCGSESDIATRHELEKAIWNAEQFRIKVSAQPLSASPEDFRASVAAYEGILADDRFGRTERDARDSEAASDIEDLRLRCKVALAELYFVEYEDYAGVTYFTSGFGPRDLLLKNHLDAALVEVRSLYKNLEDDSLETRCAGMLRQVAEDEILWLGDTRMGDTLLTVPLYLARTELDRGEARVSDHCQFAESFYSRIIRTWPDSLVAHRAYLSRADLYVLEGRFADALSDVGNALRSPYAADGREQLLLFKGEILAQGLGREAQVESVLTKVMADYPRTPSARGAMLNLAALKMVRGEEPEATRMLRDLELEADIPPETATTAMFLRALCFKRSDDWPGALNLLWRICRLEPFTRAATVAPLVIVRYYVEKADSVATDSMLEDAQKYYLDAIGKDNAYMEHPHVLKDCLIETYLLAGKPAAAARLLEEHSGEWRPANGSVGLLKSALIYMNLLDDRENGVRVLQKCLDLFPPSPYAWIVQKEINRASTSSDKPRKG